MAKARASIGEVYQVILQRRTARPDGSYVASLLAGGTDGMLRKVSEECGEVLLAAKNGDRGQTIAEIADLWFHLLVLMAGLEIAPDDIEAELGARFGTSGLAEKRSRGGN